jgi:hypothetical protein
MLQYGTQASKLPASAAVSTSLFSTGIDSVVASGSVALKDPTFVIIPLQTDVIREHLGIALISSGAGTASSIMWIENNTGETMPADAWGAGTYAANGIRIGGLNSAGSSSSTVTDFDNGIAAENHPRSLATVLYTGQTSTINFYNPNAIGNDTIIKVTDNVGSLQAANGQTVKTWLENKNPLPTPPAVSVIYKWKEN